MALPALLASRLAPSQELAPCLYFSRLGTASTCEVAQCGLREKPSLGPSFCLPRKEKDAIWQRTERNRGYSSPASLPHRPSTRHGTPHKRLAYTLPIRLSVNQSILLLPSTTYILLLLLLLLPPTTTPRFGCGSTNSTSTSRDTANKHHLAQRISKTKRQGRETLQLLQATAASYSYTRPRPFFGTLSLARFYCTSLACALPNLLYRVPRFLFPTDLLYYQLRSPASDNAVLALFVPGFVFFLVFPVSESLRHSLFDALLGLSIRSASRFSVFPHSGIRKIVLRAFSATHAWRLLPCQLSLSSLLALLFGFFFFSIPA